MSPSTSLRDHKIQSPAGVEGKSIWKCISHHQRRSCFFASFEVEIFPDYEADVQAKENSAPTCWRG